MPDNQPTSSENSIPEQNPGPAEQPSQDTSIKTQVVIPSSMTSDQAAVETSPEPKPATEPASTPTAPSPKKRAPIGKIVAWVVAIIILSVIGWLAYANWASLIDLYGKAATPASQVGNSVTPDRNIDVNPSVTPTPASSLADAMASVPKDSSFKPAGQVAGAQTQTSAVAKVMDQVATALKNKDGQALYNLLSSQLTAYFTPDSVAQAFASSGGEITLTPIGNAEYSGDWARQLVSYTHNGITGRYYVVFHLESGNWKLFGTMPAS